MVPQNTCSPARQCWLRAWGRAVGDKLIPFYVDGTIWEVRQYTVVVTGPGWSDLACNCPAGARGIVCKHAAVTAKARSLHVRPIKPAKPIAPSTPAEIAYTKQLMAQTTSSLISGVAPSLSDLYA